MDNYGSDKQIKTKAERLLPPIGTYLVRKIVLGLILTLLFTARQVSKVYGFNYSAEVSDRDEWVWDVRKKIPVVRARVERMD